MFIKKLFKIPKLNVKIILFFLLHLIGVVVVQMLLVNSLASHNVHKDESEDCLGFAQEICDMITYEDLSQWLGQGKNEKYEYNNKWLISMLKRQNLDSVFIYCPIYDQNQNLTDKVEFIYDIRSETSSQNMRQSLGTVSRISEMKEAREVFEKGTDLTFEDEANNSYYVTSLSPIKDPNGKVKAIVAVNVSNEELTDLITQELVSIAVVLTLVLGVYAAVFILFMNHSVLRPVRILSSRMDHFVENGTTMNYQPITSIKTGDELEHMANNFNIMAGNIVEYTNNIEKDTKERENMKAKFDISEQMRMSVSADLSEPSFMERNDFELYASMQNTVHSKYSFCNYFLVSEDVLCIMLGESGGRALPAMIASMLTSSNIQCYAKMGYPPYRIALETNNQLSSMTNMDPELSTSCIIATVDLKAGILTYVNAGMPPILIKRTNEEYLVENASIQFNLGEMKGVTFTQETVKLSQGNTLIFTSYGVPEMRNRYGERFNESGLKEEINSIAGQYYTLEEMIGELEKRLEKFRQGEPVELDTTILGFRYFG